MTGEPADHRRQPRRDAVGHRRSSTSRRSASSALTRSGASRASSSGIGLALGVQIGGAGRRTPPPNAGADPGFWYWPQAIVEKRFGPTGQFKHRAQRRLPRPHRERRRRSPSGNGNVRRREPRHLRRRHLAGASSSRSTSWPRPTARTCSRATPTSDVKLRNEAVGGIKLFVERNSYLMLGGGARYTNGFEAADVRGVPRLHLRAVDRRPRRRRHQGRRRQVPRRARRTSTASRTRTAAPIPDNDNDGIPDVDDRCPNEPEDRDGDQDEDGCPEGERRRSRRRRHPRLEGQVPRRARGPRRLPGRTTAAPTRTTTRTASPTSATQCPNDPEDKDGFEDADGCPDPDNDQDGIPDVDDKCPNEPETYNGFEDEDGCPDKGSVIIQDNNIVILDKIKFAHGSAPRSSPSRTRSSTPSRRRSTHHPEFTLIEVAGHADERASDEYNLQPHAGPRELGHARRSSQRGVDESRLRSKGYGEYCPDDPGHNEAAWETEPPRRVQDRQDEGRPHGRRARLRQRDGARGAAGSDQVAHDSSRIAGGWERGRRAPPRSPPSRASAAGRWAPRRSRAPLPPRWSARAPSRSRSTARRAPVRILLRPGALERLDGSLDGQPVIPVGSAAREAWGDAWQAGDIEAIVWVLAADVNQVIAELRQNPEIVDVLVSMRDVR